MKANRKQLFWIISAETITGTVIYLAVTYFFSFVPFIDPPKNWLYVGIKGFFIMLFVSCLSFYFIRIWNKTKNDKIS